MPFFLYLHLLPFCSWRDDLLSLSHCYFHSIKMIHQRLADLSNQQIISILFYTSLSLYHPITHSRPTFPHAIHFLRVTNATTVRSLSNEVWSDAVTLIIFVGLLRVGSRNIRNMLKFFNAVIEFPVETLLIELTSVKYSVPLIFWGNLGNDTVSTWLSCKQCKTLTWSLLDMLLSTIALTICQWKTQRILICNLC